MTILHRMSQQEVVNALNRLQYVQKWHSSPHTCSRSAADNNKFLAFLESPVPFRHYSSVPWHTFLCSVHKKTLSSHNVPT